MKPTAAAERNLRPELMDDPALGLAETERALADLDRITFWSGGILPVTRTLAKRVAAGRRRQTLLDLGTGSGLVPAAVAKAARRAGVVLRIVGCDRKLSHLLYGRRRGHRQLRVVSRAEQLPFGDGVFDWSLSTLLLHHFDRATNRLVLSEMTRVARARSVILDLRRSRLAPLLFRLLAALLRMGPVARYDGLVSLAQAWTRTEVERLASGLVVVESRRRFPFRFSLVLKPAPGARTDATTTPLGGEPRSRPAGGGSPGRGR